MQKFKQFISIILKIKELLVVLAAIALWILNIWFANKYNPVVKDIEAFDARILENKSDIKEIRSDLTSIKEDTAYIRGKLDGQN